TSKPDTAVDSEFFSQRSKGFERSVASAGKHEHCIASACFKLFHHQAPGSQERRVVLVGVQIGNHAGYEARAIDLEPFAPRSRIQLCLGALDAVRNDPNPCRLDVQLFDQKACATLRVGDKSWRSLHGPALPRRPGNKQTFVSLIPDA